MKTETYWKIITEFLKNLWSLLEVINYALEHNIYFVLLIFQEPDIDSSSFKLIEYLNEALHHSTWSSFLGIQSYFHNRWTNLPLNWIFLLMNRHNDSENEEISYDRHRIRAVIFTLLYCVVEIDFTFKTDDVIGIF